MARTTRRVARAGIAISALSVVLLAAGDAAVAELRFKFQWDGEGDGPTIFVRTAPGNAKVADYNSGQPCGLPSGTPCMIYMPGVRWEEADVEGPRRAKTISLFVDGPWTPFSYGISNYNFLTGQPAPIRGTATAYQEDGAPIEQTIDLAPGEHGGVSDKVPPQPRKLGKLGWDPTGLNNPRNRRVKVGNSRLVRITGVSFTCGTQTDRACVIYGRAAHDQPHPMCLRRRCRYDFRIYRPMLGRFRFVVPAGQTLSPLRIRLSRSGFRYVKRHRRIRFRVLSRYALLGEERPACEGQQQPQQPSPCHEKRRPIVIQLRYKGR